MNLSLAINNGMYVCMPLYSQDLTDGMPALVLSLQVKDFANRLFVVSARILYFDMILVNYRKAM